MPLTCPLPVFFQVLSFLIKQVHSRKNYFCDIGNKYLKQYNEWTIQIQQFFGSIFPFFFHIDFSKVNTNGLREHVWYD